jgi:hypothetical protein
MVSFAVIEIGFVIVALILSWIHVRWLRKRALKRNEIDELNDLFNYFWDGTDENERYAWYKVRNHELSMVEETSPTKLEYIEQRLRRLSSNPMKSGTYIDENGYLKGKINQKNEY